MLEPLYMYLVCFGIKKITAHIFLFLLVHIRHLIHTLCKSKIIKNQYNIYSAIHSFLIPQHATLHKQLLIKYHHVVRNTVLVLHACIDVFRIYTNNLHYYTNIHDRYLYIYDVDIVSTYTFFIHFKKHILLFKSYVVCKI